MVEDPDGLVATAEDTLSAWVEKQAEGIGRGRLRVEQPDPEDPRVIRYVFEQTLTINKAEDGDLDFATLADALDQIWREGMPPKPNLKDLLEAQEEAAESAATDTSGLLGPFPKLPAIVGIAAKGAEAQMSVESWYLIRILSEVGLPQMRTVVELPGKIVAHTVDGKPAGDRKGNRVTFEIGPDFVREFGYGNKQLRVVSLLGGRDPQEEGGEKPHMIWDGKDDAPDCGCICEKGWEREGDGECVSCEQTCPEWDPRSVYDPARSEPNNCACRCVKGWKKNAQGTECVEDKGEERSCDDRMIQAIERMLQRSDTKDYLILVEGYEDLTPSQRDALERLLDRMADYIPRSQLDMLRWLKEQEARRRQQEQEVADRIADELRERQRTQAIVQREIRRETYGEWLADLLERGQIIGDFYNEIKNRYEELGNRVKYLTNPDQAARDILEQYIKERALAREDTKTQPLYGPSAGEGYATPEEAAQIALEHVEYIATSYSVIHYRYYLQEFDKRVKEKYTDAEEAHEAALAELRRRVEDAPMFGLRQSKDSPRPFGHPGGPGSYAWMKPGGVYDKAFQKLNPRV